MATQEQWLTVLTLGTQRNAISPSYLRIQLLESSSNELMIRVWVNKRRLKCAVLPKAEGVNHWSGGQCNIILAC